MIKCKRSVFPAECDTEDDGDDSSDDEAKEEAVPAFAPCRPSMYDRFFGLLKTVTSCYQNWPIDNAADRHTLPVYHLRRAEPAPQCC